MARQATTLDAVTCRVEAKIVRHCGQPIFVIKKNKRIVGRDVIEINVKTSGSKVKFVIGSN